MPGATPEGRLTPGRARTARSLESETTPEESIRSSAAFAFGVQLTTAAFTAVLMLYLVRALGPGAYGVFALALATGALVAVPADLGISASTARFVAERRGDRRAVADVIAAGFKPKLATAALIAAGLFAASRWIASAYHAEGLTWPLRAAALAFFGQTLMLFFQRTFVAQARVRPNLRIQVVESAVETGASIALVALGTGATGAMFGRAAGYLVGGAVALAVMIRLVGRAAVALSGGFGGESRRIIRYAGPLTIVDSAYTLFSQIDAVLIGLILNTTAVGLFQAPNRLITFIGYPGAAVASAVAPRLARRAGDPPDLNPLRSSIRYLIIIQAALVVPLLVWPRPIVDLLLGSGYAKSADVLQALTPYIFLVGIAPVVSLAANYLGIARRRIPITLATVAMNVVIDIILIPRIGIVGGAIGTDIAYTFYVVGHFWICKRTMDLSLRPITMVLLRTTVAGIAMAGVLLSVGTADLTAVEWLIGSVGGSLTFGLALIVTGEVSRDERRVVRGFATRRFARRFSD
jgi:O-antigen/teichoic acid export membrane protein